MMVGSGYLVGSGYIHSTIYLLNEIIYNGNIPIIKQCGVCGNDFKTKIFFIKMAVESIVLKSALEKVGKAGNGYDVLYVKRKYISNKNTSKSRKQISSFAVKDVVLIRIEKIMK